MQRGNPGNYLEFVIFAAIAGRTNLTTSCFEIAMSTVITHRRIKIVTLEHGESIAEQCRTGDIAIVQDQAGWWTHFVGESGVFDSYDAPFDSYDKALWAAKAAAEFSAE